jgi:hypothetical protein
MNGSVVVDSSFRGNSVTVGVVIASSPDGHSDDRSLKATGALAARGVPTPASPPRCGGGPRYAPERVRCEVMTHGCPLSELRCGSYGRGGRLPSSVRSTFTEHGGDLRRGISTVGLSADRPRDRWRRAVRRLRCPYAGIAESPNRAARVGSRRCGASGRAVHGQRTGGRARRAGAPSNLGVRRAWRSAGRRRDLRLPIHSGQPHRALTHGVLPSPRSLSAGDDPGPIGMCAA